MRRRCIVLILFYVIHALHPSVALHVKPEKVDAAPSVATGWNVPGSYYNRYADNWHAPFSREARAMGTFWGSMLSPYKQLRDDPDIEILELADEMENKEHIVSADFGGFVDVTFNKNIPYAGLVCYLKKAPDGWDVSELGSIVLASYKSGNSVHCPLGPEATHSAGPYELHVAKAGTRQSVMKKPIRIRYETTLAVSFDRRPYYDADGGEVLVRVNVPDNTLRGPIAKDSRLQIRVHVKGPGYVMKQLLGVDVNRTTTAAFPISFEGLPADMDHEVTVTLWQGKSNIMGIRSFGVQPVVDPSFGPPQVGDPSFGPPQVGDASFGLQGNPLDGVDPESRESEISATLATRTLRLIRVSTKKRGQSAVDFKHRSLLVDDRPFVPIAWFSTYLDFGLEDAIQSMKELAQRGVNSLMLYNLIAGPGPQSLSYKISDLPVNPHVGEILDAAHAMGIKFQVSLLEVVRPLGSGFDTDYSLLDQAVMKWKDHPAVMAWYVADDDAGYKLPQIYKRIRKMDPHHIITMAVQGVGKTKDYRFMKGSDVVMIENYPVDASGAYNNMAVIKNWPTEFMPAITCGRSWALAEDGAVVTQQLFRAQLYQSLIAGATGEIWFAYRNAEGWNEPGVPLEESASEAARELLDLSIALSSSSDFDPTTFIPPTESSGRTELNPIGSTNVTSVRSRAFREPSGCVTLLVSNSVNEPVEATVQFGFGSAGIFDENVRETEALAVHELSKELRRVPVKNGQLKEFMPAFGVQVFRLNGTSTCAHDSPRSSAGSREFGKSRNYFLNPSFEEFGAYISDPLNWVCGMGPNGGEGSSCYADTEIQMDGRHSGRFATGRDPDKFHIHPDVDFKIAGTYTGSIWAQSDTPGMNLFVGVASKLPHFYQRNLAPKDFSSLQSITLTNQWQEFKFSVELSKDKELAFKTDLPGVLWLDKATLFLDGGAMQKGSLDLDMFNQQIDNLFRTISND